MMTTASHRAHPAYAGSGYARHVGRVGALAVALGVGVAVATGPGLWVARADDTNASSSDNSPSDTSTSDPSDSTQTDHSDEPSSAPPSPSDGSDADDKPTEEDDVVPEMDLDDSGGDGVATDDGLLTEDEPADVSEVDPPDPVVDGDFSAPDLGDETKDIAALDNSASVDAASPPMSGDGPENSPDTSVEDDLTYARSFSTFDVQDVTGGQHQLMVTNSEDTSTNRTLASLAVTEDPAPSLLSLPGAIIDVATTFISTLLSPFLSSGSGTPAEPPLFWALLGWIRNEVQRTFFNSRPVAADDAVTTSEDIGATGNVLTNDVDADEDAMRASLVAGPAHGTVVLNADGSFTYTPTANYKGTDSFTYQISDKADGFHLHGLLGLFTGRGHTDTATVNITVNTVNDLPAAGNDSATTTEDNPVTIAVLANDTDADTGAVLTPVVATNPAHGTVGVNANGTITYTPNADYSGTDSFTYKASDGAASSTPATVSVTVSPVNDAPVAANDTATTTAGTPVTVNVLTNDSDVEAGSTLTPVVVTSPSRGTLQATPTGWTYTPATGFTGTDSFTYKVNDGTADSNVAKVSIAVAMAPTNTAPIATDNEFTTTAGTALTIDLADFIGDDTDADGDPLHLFDITNTPPIGGTFEIVDDQLVYTPSAGFTGDEVLTYQVSDGTAASNEASITIHVTTAPANRPPTALSDELHTTPNTNLTITPAQLTANDTDPDGNTTITGITIIDQPSHGTFIVAPGDAFTYVPNPNYTGTDTFTYQATDIHGATSNTTTVTITISTNRPPTAGDDTFTVEANTETPLSIEGLLGNDIDPDGDPLTLDPSSIVTHPQHGTLTGPGLIYTPDTDFTGTDTFTYRLNDGTFQSNIATVTITVIPTNRPPTALSDELHTTPNTNLTITPAQLTANDTDPDGNTTITGITIIDQPSHGTFIVAPGDAFTYVPNPNYTGTDTFTYQATDIHGATSNTTTVTITVLPNNTPPTARDDAFTYPTNAERLVAILINNDTDPEGTMGLGGTITAELVDAPTHGLVVVTPDGAMHYIPGETFTTTDTFTYRLRDGLSTSNTATVTITAAPNTPPSAGDDAFIYPTNAERLVAILINNDTDPEGTMGLGGTITAELVDAPTHGLVVVTPDGAMHYIPGETFTTTDTFTYRLRDGFTTSNTATVTISAAASS